MPRSNQRGWYPVGASQSQGLVFWKFTGKEISSFSSAVGGGFTAFFILQSLGIPLVFSLGIGVIIPGLVTVFLLTLVCGKPASYAACVLELALLRMTGRSLFKPNPIVIDEEVS